ncbi:hypothetical protein SBA2_360048 [Acidobacteriia bacterium SbA2]|nr:hypothetical protein SBA2_360048 [Acidobacteriia bacterium SbA2]
MLTVENAVGSGRRGAFAFEQFFLPRPTVSEENPFQGPDLTLT